MTTYTPEHVRSLKMPEQTLLSDALEAFAVKLEQDTAVNRDTAADPQPGDLVRLPGGKLYVFIGVYAGTSVCWHKDAWASLCSMPGAEIVRNQRQDTASDMLEDLRWLAQRYGGVVDPSRLSRYLDICKRWKV